MNFSDTVKGEVEVEYKRLCRDCGAVGKMKPVSGILDTALCSACGGKGIIKETFYMLGKSVTQNKELRCIKCWGLGIVSNAKTCATCNGTTFEPTRELKKLPFEFATRIQTKNKKKNRVRTVKVYGGKEYAPIYLKLVDKKEKEQKQEQAKK
jgi:DnaJ-class molecular chaperone